MPGKSKKTCVCVNNICWLDGAKVNGKPHNCCRNIKKAKKCVRQPVPSIRERGRQSIEQFVADVCETCTATDTLDEEALEGIVEKTVCDTTGIVVTPADPNGFVVIAPKGTGFLSADCPTPGSAEGGNCRGNNAVDLQISRTAATQVASGNYSGIVAGQNNSALGVATFVGAGIGNIAGGSGTGAFVGAGTNNKSVGVNSVIVGGTGNSNLSRISFIGGGSKNSLTGYGAVISGGRDNTSGSDYTVCSGGANNVNGERYSFIGGGLSNTAGYVGTVVCGGTKNNVKSGSYSSIVGGVSNEIQGASCMIGGGEKNSIAGGLGTMYGVIGGGFSNSIEVNCFQAGIFSGRSNKISANNGNNSVISGGESNIINSSYSVIGGGQSNNVETNFSSILGGKSNKISDQKYSVICGGKYNEILGSTTFASSAIVGGLGNNISGPFTSSCFINQGIYNTIGGYQSVGCNIRNGTFNSISGKSSIFGGIIGGGGLNTISNISGRSYYNSIENGLFNLISEGAKQNTIVNGKLNIIEGPPVISSETNNCIIGSGYSNRIGSTSIRVLNSIIGGGKGNKVYSSYSSIGGGELNKTYSSTTHDVVGGGFKNYCGGSHSVIGGGKSNKITSMGAEVGTIPGGEGIIIDASTSHIFACGKFNDFSSVPGGMGATGSGLRAFVVGRGDSDGARENLMSIDTVGNMFLKGVLTTSTTADYAEFFETENGEEIPAGYAVCLGADGKVRVADPNDPSDVPIGVISKVSSIIADAQDDVWQGKYLRSPFGEVLYEEREERVGEDEVKARYQTLIDGVGSGYLSGLFKTVEDQVADLTRQMEEELAKLPVNKIRQEKLNPDYDPERQYVPRKDRPEWVIVGLVGKIPLLKGQAVNANWHKMKDINEQVELWLVK